MEDNEFVPRGAESTRDGRVRAANVKRVYGDPIELRGRTLVPVARGGVVPLGVYEVTHDRTRFVPAHDLRRLLTAALAGLAVGYVLGRRAED